MQQVQRLQTTAIERPRSRGRFAEIARHWPEYLCIAPFFVLFGVFFAYPIAWSFVLSFQRWDGITKPRWVGFDNYSFVLHDTVTHQMFFNTLRFLVILVPLGLILPLVFGVILNLPFLRLRGVFRTILFIPVVTSVVVVGIVWRLLFGTANGWLNGLISHVGLGPYNWLKDPTLAQVPIVSLTVWGGVGFSTLIVLGGLQAIDQEIYDAARVDGASGWRTFWQITLPLMRPVMLFLLITSTISVTTLFSQAYVVTRGGPSNETLTPLLHIYNIGIGTSGAPRIGDATALSFLLSAFMLVVVFVQLRLVRRRGDD
ncbi:MAG: lactose/L-arabinose transport system permease protein [Thermomicrobiales bacterium]|jgi:ABC-type sugar transport system permease subunit|nr:lactose/L-arabinose transport system permease protein [Thermomicrobiales bacterium]MEA2528116.1 lactose/L-arabinose transport system permease protein [Thermomicrobiales bacterium]MEA2528819.1 lactose/L-arabinose transport system permease protein [Thermomicrobiales bacterium]